MDARYLLTVKVPKGLVVRSAPVPTAKENKPALGAGVTVEAYRIVNIGGAEYAQLVPRPSYKNEWIRVRDVDIDYVDVVDLGITNSTDNLAKAIREAGSAINAGLVLLATAIRELARK